MGPRFRNKILIGNSFIAAVNCSLFGSLKTISWGMGKRGGVGNLRIGSILPKFDTALVLDRVFLTDCIKLLLFV